jgi:hypothetical protein
VFLEGDAAHMMPPMAAAGANTAIADAANLAWKLAAVLTGQAAPVLLDTYEAERRPAGYAIAEASSTVRGHVGDMLAAYTKPESRHDDLLATMFGTQCPEGAFVPDGRGPAPVDHCAPAGRPGTRVPHVWLDAETSTVDYSGPGLALLTGPDNGRWIAEANRLGLRQAIVSHQDWLTEVCLPTDGALLLRPDVIVAWCSASGTPLAEALTRVLGTAAVPAYRTGQLQRKQPPASTCCAISQAPSSEWDPVAQVVRLDGRMRESPAYQAEEDVCLTGPWRRCHSGERPGKRWTCPGSGTDPPPGWDSPKPVCTFIRIGLRTLTCTPTVEKGDPRTVGSGRSRRIRLDDPLLGRPAGHSAPGGTGGRATGVSVSTSHARTGVESSEKPGRHRWIVDRTIVPAFSYRRSCTDANVMATTAARFSPGRGVDLLRRVRQVMRPLRHGALVTRESSDSPKSGVGESGHLKQSGVSKDSGVFVPPGHIPRGSERG